MLAIAEPARTVQEGVLIGILLWRITDGPPLAAIDRVRRASLGTLLRLELQPPHLYRRAYTSRVLTLDDTEITIHVPVNASWALSPVTKAIVH